MTAYENEPQPTGATAYDPSLTTESYTEQSYSEERSIEDRSLGSIVSEMSSNLSKLMRQEVQLAKVEMQEEAKKVGKAAGLLGGAGFAGWMAALFASLTIMWALDHAMDIVWAALIVTALWAIAGAVMFVTGRKKMAEVNPKPEHTVETLKEDKEWLKAQKN
jgi:uncharacterized membrane protein YqjE